jgi:hypothetical protein
MIIETVLQLHRFRFQLSCAMKNPTPQDRPSTTGGNICCLDSEKEFGIISAKQLYKVQGTTTPLCEGEKKEHATKHKTRFLRFAFFHEDG